MPDFFSEGNTPRRSDTRWTILQKILGATIANGSGGGGAGSVAAEGANYCITGTAPNQVFKLKNLDTGAANRIDARDANPNQNIEVQPQSAC